jgi:hypothetical protein
LVEGTTLLTWQGVKPLEGSNPSLSSKIKREPILVGSLFICVYCVSKVMHNVKTLCVHVARQSPIDVIYLAEERHCKVMHRALHTCVYCVYKLAIDT